MLAVITAAFMQGWFAYYNFVVVCPYDRPIDPVLSKAWHNGWMSACHPQPLLKS
jgi:hypothetical protein